MIQVWGDQEPTTWLDQLSAVIIGKYTLLCTTLSNIFRTVTPVWIHIWRWNGAPSLMLLTRGALLFFNVIHQISRSHRWYKSSILTQIGRFRTVTPVWIHQWLWNDAQSLKQHRRGALLFFQGHPSIVKVTQDKKSQILTQIERFRTVTPVWIYQWLWNAAKKA